MLTPHPPLAVATRLAFLRGTRERIGIPEVAVLLALGCGAAALTLFVDLGLRIPGHAVLRAVVPISLGLALVPRRNAGAVAGLGALAGALAMGGWPIAIGPGALASLALTGPILDLALRFARSGRSIYAALIAGGLASNLLAFVIRLVPKLFGETGHRPLSAWWPEAIVTYSLCGAAAGLVSAALWFRFRARRSRAE